MRACMNSCMWEEGVYVLVYVCVYVRARMCSLCVCESVYVCVKEFACTRAFMSSRAFAVVLCVYERD